MSGYNPDEMNGERKAAKKKHKKSKKSDPHV